MPRARLTECDPKLFFNHGLSFEFAALELQAKSHYLSNIIVIAVNHAFASELYLKCLTASDGSLPWRTHNLNTLWEDLPEATRNMLLRKWPETHAGAQELVDLGNAKYGLPPITVPVPPLADVIQNARTAFEDLRYPGKGSWISVNFRMAMLFRKEILERYPDWSPKAADPRSRVLTVK